MLAVHSDHLPSPAIESEQEPSLSEVDISVPKQQTKRKLFTPLNILILLATLTIIGAGTYYILSSDAKDMKNQIKESHDKIITYADSSKKDGSNTGSSSSKASTSSDKPIPRSRPAGKDVISSNPKLTGGPSGGGDDEDDEERDDNSEKKKSMGSSTEVDSEEDEQEESDEEDYENDPVVWIDQNNPTNSATPSVGSTRDGGR